MTSVHEIRCKNCDKKYYRQTAYDKHIIWCGVEPLLDNINNINNINDINDIELKNELGEIKKSLPSQKNNRVLKSLPLEEIVLELVRSNIKLKKDIDELKRWVQTKKRKINILEWINEKMQSNPTQIPEKNYKEYISDIVITRKDLEIVFKSDLINGIQEILEKHFSSSEILPFKSFDQKDNTIYVYTENSKWELLLTEDFNKRIFQISKQLLTEFQKWKEENEYQLYTDNFSTICIQNMKKVIGGDVSLDKQQSKIHRNLYKYLKKNLQNTIEYEFV